MVGPDGAPQDHKTSPRLSRRGLLLAGGGVILVAGSAAFQWFNPLATTGAGALSAPDARDAALAGALLLVDIRRPDEWRLTGTPEGALPLDMRRPDFEARLLEAAGQDRDRPIALICARGVRSRRLGARLKKAGFTQVIDVPEGMLGSGAGPGWLRRGLPVLDAPA
jgi:rhodanese-related sulfurtransferase